MRKVLMAALLVAAVLLPQPAEAHQHRDWREERCRYARLDGEGGYSQREVALTIECAARHWQPVSGGVDKALDVARCESGLRADALGGGTYIGVYQFHPDTWRRAREARVAFARRWDVARSAWNGRANVLIAARIFSNTWSPWSCA